MGRTKEREQAFFLIFEDLFNSDNAEAVELYSENVKPLGEYAKNVYLGVKENLEEIDGLISKYSKGWKINRIPKVNLAILRLSVYEVMYCDDVPDSVSVNEAVELAKKYSGEDDFAYVNGILGSVVRNKKCI